MRQPSSRPSLAVPLDDALEDTLDELGRGLSLMTRTGSPRPPRRPDDPGPDEQAARGIDVHGLGYLEGGGHDLVADGDMSERAALDPLICRLDTAGLLGRQVDPGLRPDAEGLDRFAELGDADALGELDRSDVGRLDEDLGEAQHALPVVVGDRRPADPDEAGAAVEDLGEADPAALADRGGGDDLEDRAGS
jgi:hypothetical protein